MPNWLEICIVIGIVLGLQLCSSIYSFVSGAAFKSVQFSDLRIFEILVYEILVSAIALGFLYLRGYKLWKQIGFALTIRSVGLSVALFFATQAAYIGLWMLVSVCLRGSRLPMAEYVFSVTLPYALAIALINPLFEEAFLLGYLFDKLQEKSVWIFLSVTTLIRVAGHLYQGWVGIISILPMAIIFAAVYRKSRNLMPFYLSHAAMDLVGLLLN
jgi:membrane protease YdiL (CAAX protease family)